jgi:hypothetical protein
LAWSSTASLGDRDVGSSSFLVGEEEGSEG